MRVPGRANPASASSAAILPRAACWAGLIHAAHRLRSSVSFLSTVFYWGQPGGSRCAGTGIAGLYRRLAAVVGVPAGRGLRPGGGDPAEPDGRERAKNLLWAAGRLADWATGLGLDPVPEVLLHSSVIERFTAHAPGLTGVTRRTLRTSLRFLARAVVPRWPRRTRRCPASGPRRRIPGRDRRLSRARRRAADRGAADAGGRAGLPGRRRGLIRADLRQVRGTDISARSGGVIVTVRGEQATGRAGAGPIPRAAAGISWVRRARPVTGGTDPGRRNVTTPLITSLAGGTGLPRLDTSRLRATWLADCARTPWPGHLHARRRDHLQPAAR